MLSEHNIQSLGDGSVERLSDKELQEVVVDGPGKVTLAEVLTLVHIIHNEKIPVSVINSVRDVAREEKRKTVEDAIQNWNDMLRLMPDKVSAYHDFQLSIITDQLSMSNTPANADYVGLKKGNLAQAVITAGLELEP